MRARGGKGPDFSRIRAGMQARIPIAIFQMTNDRKVPMNHIITVTSARYWRCPPPCDGKPGLQDLKREYNEVFEAFICGNDVFTAPPTNSRKTCASLFSLWCLISDVETHPQCHCISPLVPDRRVFTSLGWLRLAN